MKTASLRLLEVMVVRVNVGGGAPPDPPSVVTSRAPSPLFSQEKIFDFWDGCMEHLPKDAQKFHKSFGALDTRKVHAIFKASVHLDAPAHPKHTTTYRTTSISDIFCPFARRIMSTSPKKSWVGWVQTSSRNTSSMSGKSIMNDRSLLIYA